MVTLYLMAALTAQASSAPNAGVKTCPDRSRVLVSDTCAPLIDHRYIMSHEPESKVKTIEWWCRGDRRPSMARVRIVQHQRRDSNGQPISPIKAVELTMLKVKGQTPSANSRRKITQSLVSLNDAELRGRCLLRQNGGIQPVLMIRGYKDGRRDPVNLDIELDPAN